MERKRGFLDTLNISFGGVGLTELSLFAKHLSVMLKSGLPIAEALEIAADSASGRLRYILGEVTKSVRSGNSLYSSFTHYPHIFSKFFLGSLFAGESSGTLEGSLEEISVGLEKERELKAKIKGAMVYPVIILIAVFLLGLLLSFLILPKLTNLLKELNVALPLTTRILIWFSEVIQRYGIFVLIGIFASLMLIVFLLRQAFIRPLLNWFFLHLPVARRVTRNANLARFCRVLATLIKSGVQIDEALEISRQTVSNFYYQRSLAQVARHVREGSKLSANLAHFEYLFPKLVTRMIHVGEESGRLEETLFYLASFYELEVDSATKSLSATIEPLLLLFVGLVVAFLSMSIMNPIFEFTGGIEK